MLSDVETSTEPMGAPSPFDRHRETVSNSVPYDRIGTPVATWALPSRAPSRCRVMPASRQRSEIARMDSYGWIAPPPKLWVFSSATTPVSTMYGFVPIESIDATTSGSATPPTDGNVRVVTPCSAAWAPSSARTMCA